MIGWWWFLFRLLGAWTFLRFVLRDPDLVPILLTMVVYFIFFELVYVSSDRLIKLGYKKKYFSLKKEVDISWKVSLFVISLVLVIWIIYLVNR